MPEDWISRLKANDEKVLKALYTACYHKVEKFVLDNSGSQADAEDLFHEAFIATWRNIQLDRIAISTEDKLQGYIFRVAQFKWLDQLRQKKRQQVSMPDITDSQQPDLPVSVEEEDYLEKVKQSYALLGHPCKEVLNRFYFLKESMADIAAAFSWTEATAKNNKYRCLQRLRSHVIPKKTTS